MSDVYTTRWPEERVLDYFWLMVHEGADRIALLKQLLTVAIQRPPEWSKAAAREVHQPYPKTCFCCLNGDRRLYWHHVVTVDHGGSNFMRNLVAVCLRCHSQLHPWLPADRPGEARTGFHHVGALAEPLRIVMDIEQVKKR